MKDAEGVEKHRAGRYRIKKPDLRRGLKRYSDSSWECGDAKVCTNSDLITQDMWIDLSFYTDMFMLKQIHLNSMKCEVTFLSVGTMCLACWSSTKLSRRLVCFSVHFYRLDEITRKCKRQLVTAQEINVNVAFSWLLCYSKDHIGTLS